MNESESVFTAEAWFTGHVQGVGFRYKARETAKEFAVCGEVKNLSDGRVYLCAEGTRREVEAFLHELEDSMAPFIRKSDKKVGESPRRYRDFAITVE